MYQNLVADLHVHFYPEYDLGKLLSFAYSNLSEIAHGTALEGQNSKRPIVLGLAERFDCHYYRELKQGNLLIPAWVSRAGEEELELLLENSEGHRIFILPGRQIVTAERLELLAFGVDVSIADGVTFEEGKEKILEAGGLPVLNWAPGKWMFERFKIVEEIIDRGTSESLLVCDTILRPTLWAEPRLIKRARERGISVIAGSDPLPFAGEEKYAGSYGLSISVERPFKSVRSLLIEALSHPSKSSVETIGSRGSAVSVFQRVSRHMLRKKLG